MMNNSIFIDSIEDLLADFRAGKMVILVDDEERENEGDLLVAAECVTSEHINFMASHGRGLICLALTEERCNQLELPLMVSRNNTRFATNFTVSIESAEGVTTGISAHDRAHTVRTAVRADATPKHLVTPGHIFPIKAQPGGVLTRAGHTEAAIDLARLAGFESAGVICEILKPDGSMARLPDLIKFGKTHGIRIGTIADLINYRMQNDPTVERVFESHLQLEQGNFRSFIYRDMFEGGVHMALVHGEIDPRQPIPVRVHVQQSLFDMVVTPTLPSSWSLKNVLENIVLGKSGVLVLLSYDESSNELAGRIKSQHNTAPTERTKHSDNPVNLRMLGAGGQILADLNVRKVLALGRKKRPHGLSGFGLEIIDYITDPQQLSKWRQKHE